MIHAMIINWPRQTERAERLEATIRPLVAKCDVINGDSSASRRGWIDAGDAYWGEQMEIARGILTEEVAFIIAADVWHDDLANIISRSGDLMGRYPIGIYCTDVDHTSWRFAPDRLERTPEPNLYHVPQTDMGLVYFVRSSLFRQLPPRMGVSRFGWGIDSVLIALAKRSGLWVVRDYRFTAIHAHGSGYQRAAARQAMDAWYATLPVGLREEATEGDRIAVEAMRPAKHREQENVPKRATRLRAERRSILRRGR